MDTMISQTSFDSKDPNITTRRIAILVADVFELTQVAAAHAAFLTQGARTFIIGPRRGNINSSVTGKESGWLPADFSWESGRSTLFDALYIPGGVKSALTLRESGRCIHWVREAFHHCKPIAANGEGVDFIRDT